MKKFISIIIILVLALPAYWRLFRPGYFSMHDDLQVMRMYEIEKCMNDGQIPCRWSPDMVFGYGQAMFNFYSALPYYLGVLIRVLLPLSILGTVKILFLISLLGGGIGMYLLARELWGDVGGIASSLAYIYAPYKALDLYVRGAMSESFSLMILPFLWLYLLKLIKERKFKYLVLSSIWLFALLTTHNISTMIMAPFTILWAGFWIVKNKNIKALFDLLLVGIIGVGLSAFFILPAMGELNLVSADLFKSDYFSYHIHFVSLRQLFLSRDWGYGPSAFGDNDDLSFQIGIVHWIGVALTSLFILLIYMSKTKLKWDYILVGGLGLLFLFSSFMTHQRSYFIWEAIPRLQFVQFPWRFLGLSVFFASVIIGAGFKYLSVFKALVLPIFIFVLIVLNFNFFKSEHYFYEETDQSKLTGTLFEILQKAAPLDYLPLTVHKLPQEINSGPKILQGKGTLSNFNYQTNSFFFDADIFDDSQVEIPIIYYPKWEVFDTEINIPFEIHESKGTIVVNLDYGRHMIYGRFVNTPLRDWANFISGITTLGLFALWIIKINKGAVLWYKS